MGKCVSKHIKTSDIIEFLESFDKTENLSLKAKLEKAMTLLALASVEVKSEKLHGIILRELTKYDKQKDNDNDIPDEDNGAALQE